MPGVALIMHDLFNKARYDSPQTRNSFVCTDDATGDRVLRNLKASGKAIAGTALPVLPAQGDQHAVHGRQITLQRMERWSHAAREATKFALTF
jgi:hypothetical protein